MRSMLTLVAICALAVSQLPSRMTPAAASGGVTYASAVDGLNETASAADLCPPTAGPMTVCTPEGCTVVRSGPIRSVVRSVSYAAPQRVVYRSVSRQPVFRGDERFMQRGPARRVFGRVGRGVCRVAFAPIRWLRCR